MSSCHETLLGLSFNREACLPKSGVPDWHESISPSLPFLFPSLPFLFFIFSASCLHLPRSFFLPYLQRDPLSPSLAHSALSLLLALLPSPLLSHLPFKQINSPFQFWFMHNILEMTMQESVSIALHRRKIKNNKMWYLAFFFFMNIWTERSISLICCLCCPVF